jgi:RNA-directed DNA polymerase
MMYELEKSDSLVVPMKSANKTGLPAAESMEGSGGIARNAELQSTVRTLCRPSCVPSARPHTCGRYLRPSVIYSR